MSVLIKGLKMPRWCNECKFHYWRDSLCEITNKEVDDDASMRGVQPWCPITKLPDHGDLVIKDGEIVEKID